MFPLLSSYLAMILTVIASNYLVLFPINDWLTWGAFSYPISFLITELTNRIHGPRKARSVVYIGFALGILLSMGLATPRIAIASGAAFLASQLLDIYVFNRLRQKTWWYAPFFASLGASCLDSLLFWTIAFFGEDVPLLTWAIGDTGIKFLIDLVMLLPFRLAMKRLAFALSPPSIYPQTT